MEGLWWLLLVILVIFFGKNIPFIANLENGFVQPNAVPTPDGIPAITIQNQTSPPENQPAPWKSICASPVASPSPSNPILFTQGQFPARPVQRVTFSASPNAS